MIWNLPNLLTIIRLVAAIAIGLAFLFFPRPIADWIAVTLFISASLTDYFDGWLARHWKQETRFGAMLDPIADKAMVIIALSVVLALHGVSSIGGSVHFIPAYLIPIVLIQFREVFVSGLREFLGSDAKRLSVTRLAKWKTTVQMVAIGLVLSTGIFEHYLWALTVGMDAALIDGILSGEITDHHAIRPLYFGLVVTETLSVVLLWLAAVLTFATGWDYFRKALPFLRDAR